MGKLLLLLAICALSAAEPNDSSIRPTVRPADNLDYILEWAGHLTLISCNLDSSSARVATYDKDGRLLVYYSAPYFRRVADDRLIIQAQQSLCWGPEAGSWNADSFVVAKSGPSLCIDATYQQQDVSVIPLVKASAVQRAALVELNRSGTPPLSIPHASIQNAGGKRP